jgi:ABC-2 type transport system ATP-binding protein
VGLDPKGTRLVKNLFRDLSQEGMTIFLSTHVLGIAEETCQRIGILNGGQMIALGTVDDLRKQAKIADSRLEAIFLKLTEEESQEGIAK